jgi:BolA family transcriptional regulator, general stress-responsive regulator
MSIAATIREKLMIALRPTRLDVINESYLHAGHRSSPGTGESHFRVLVMSPKFAGKSRVDRHRLVNDTLAAELKGRVDGVLLLRRPARLYGAAATLQGYL